MRGMMMDVPLLVPSLLRHAALYHGDTEIVSRTVEGPIHRYTYADAWRRVHQLANALTALDVRPGDRIGTLAWNGHRHMEVYYAVSGIGLVCHTVNPRLFPDQIAYIINHAEDRYVFTDLTFVPLLEGLADRLAGVKGFIVMTGEANMPASSRLPNLICYETLIRDQDTRYHWPDIDENTASSMCYSSGTTGDPKGVLYSHRSTILHAWAACMPDTFALSALDTVMPVVPMFHVNAWGTPYAAPMAGSRIVFPGPRMDGASLYELIESEGVTFTAGVPTIWMGLLSWMGENGKRFSSLNRVGIGGSACPPVMIEQFRDLDVRVIHAWGMTETSPLGIANTLKTKHLTLALEERIAVEARQGRPLYGMEFRVVDAEGRDVPRDGAHFGRLLVRGPWVCSGYFKESGGHAHAEAGWFETGDVVTMDADGYMLIVDRTKDVIKSGGEWISSIELENIAVSHPAVREAAVIARNDPRWGERPLLVVVLKDGAALTQADMTAFYEGKVAKWCIPDAMVIASDLPHTATGKLLKARLREMYRDYQPDKS